MAAAQYVSTLGAAAGEKKKTPSGTPSQHIHDIVASIKERAPPSLLLNPFSGNFILSNFRF